MSQPQCYVRLRGAVFAENGYCLDAPAGITKTSCVFLSTLDRNGKVVQIENMLGTDRDGEPTLNVPLRPYSDREFARGLVLLMTANLERALAGELKARECFGAAWHALVLGATGFEYAPAAQQFELVCAFFGKGRVMDALNLRGHIGGLADSDPGAMVAEALDLQ